MLIALQFPFTDARCFLQEETHQLATPVWGNADPSRDFVRAIGPIRSRRKGALAEWPEEDTYCRVSSAVRFDPASYQAVKDPALSDLHLRRFCAFRRFMADGRFPQGSVMTRLEFGFGFRGPKQSRPILSAEAGIACATSSLRLPVTVRGGKFSKVIPLIEVREQFDHLYLRSTTQRKDGQTPASPSWWYRGGQPLALVEFPAGQWPTELPGEARSVPGLAGHGIHLAHVKVEFAGTSLGIWLIGRAAGNADKDLLRRLRIHLFRLHAERQSLAEILRLVRQKKIAVKPGTPATEQLQRYLRDAIKFLNEPMRDGLPQSEILGASQQAEDFARPGEREKLLGELEKIRPAVFNKTAAYLVGALSDAAQTPDRNKVFISYSHRDTDFLDEFLIHLKPLERAGVVGKWSDKQIEPGSQWFNEIKAAIDSTKVAVLMVSPGFLASDFIHEHELSPLLKKAEEGGVHILWIPVKACSYLETPLKNYQAASPPDKPLAEMGAERDSAWVKICAQLKKLLQA